MTCLWLHLDQEECGCELFAFITKIHTIFLLCVHKWITIQNIQFVFFIFFIGILGHCLFFCISKWESIYTFDTNYCIIFPSNCFRRSDEILSMKRNYYLSNKRLSITDKIIIVLFSTLERAHFNSFYENFTAN